MNRTYSELATFEKFRDRYHYLQMKQQLGRSTFGFDRYLNQLLYRSTRWRRAREQVIIRDAGCDLGIEGREIYDMIIVHHLNPITIDDVKLDRACLYDPENLICVSNDTHNAIHFSDESLLPKLPITRYKGDTSPWKHPTSMMSPS